MEKNLPVHNGLMCKPFIVSVFFPGSSYSSVSGTMKEKYLHLQDVFQIHITFSFNMQWKSVIIIFFFLKGGGRGVKLQ